MSGGNIDLARFATTASARRTRRTCTRKDHALDSTRARDHTDVPERLHRLPELAADLWWTWNPQAREVFRRLDYPLWRQTAHNPVLMLRLVSQEMLDAGGRRRALPAHLRRGDRRARPRPQRARHLVAQAVPRRRRTDRLLLGGVRAAPVAADLRRRPRRAGRRPLQGGERPRHPADRRRLHVSAGLLPPDGVGRRAGSRRVYERLNWADAPVEPAMHARRPALRHRRAARQPHACWCRCGGCGSAGSSCTCSTPISRRTRRGIASCRRGSTAATARPASSRRSSSASAACAR